MSELLKNNFNINRRVDSRLITLLPIGVKAHTKTNVEIGVFQVINISKNGISLVSSAHLLRNAEILLRIKLPTHNNHPIKTIATVRRCEELTNHSDHLKQYLCVLFLNLSEEDKNEIEKFIIQVVKDGSGVVDRRNPERSKNGLVFHNPGKLNTFRLSQENPTIQTQQLSIRDLDELKNVEVAAWGKEMCATPAMLKSRLETFPEGMIGARKDGKLLGYVGLMKVNSAQCDKDFTWMGITNGGYITATHDPAGDCLYGVSLSVVPGAPKDLAVRLLKAAGKFSVRKALRGILFGCRIPNYHKHVKNYSIDEYVKATSSTGRFLDPELSLYRQVNCQVVRPIPNYFEDPESLNYGVLVFFENPFYSLQKGEFPFFFKNVSVDFT